MTQMDLFPTAISSQPDTHVNRSALPHLIEEARKMTDISGQKYLPLLKESDQLFAFSKMFMATSLWGSMKCYLTWKGKTTPQGRLLFQLLPVTHPTEETEFGSSPELWRTPDTGQGGTSGLLKQGKTHRENGQPIQIRLVDQVNNSKLWPTPRVSGQENIDTLVKRKGLQKALQHNLTAAVQMWPTPAARDYKGANGYERTKKKLENGERAQMGQLPNAVMMEEGKQISGSLNPQWVEWLMGYPEGWTDLED